jgi:Flp pilus assembly pilin Flp
MTIQILYGKRDCVATAPVMSRACHSKQGEGERDMIADHLMKLIPGRHGLTKLIIGSSIVALMISLGMVAVVGLFDFTLSPAIPSVFAAIGAAIFAARMSKQT